MKTIYTRPVCSACHVLKAKLTKEGVPFEAVTVVDEGEPKPPGRWIVREAFDALYPGVRSFPFVVEDLVMTTVTPQQPQAEAEMREAALNDLAYVNGMKMGWSLCAMDNEAGFQRIAEGRVPEAMRAIKELRSKPAPQQAEAVPSDVVRDAARYRWLRDASVPPHNFYISVPDEFHGVKYQPGEVDAYIDAAIAAQGEKP